LYGGNSLPGAPATGSVTANFRVGVIIDLTSTMKDRVS